MIISRTPYRISFFGGGSDYPAWFKEHGGAVLGTTIDKYCYISCRYLPPFFPHKNRVVWSQIELTQSAGGIAHPSARECLKYLDLDGVEIHHVGDLPAKTGLGTSSAFTVGLLNALYALTGAKYDSLQLARHAIEIEQNKINEKVGCQDQILTAVGGFNQIVFHKDGAIGRIGIPEGEGIEPYLMLFFTGFSRTASQIAEDLIENIPSKKHELVEMTNMVSQARDLLEGERFEDFGLLLHESWMLKKRLSDKISTPYVDYLYQTAMDAGALGGKLLGAGGAGFILFFVEPELHFNVKLALKGLLYVPFKFENEGTKIIFNDSISKPK